MKRLLALVVTAVSTILPLVLVIVWLGWMFFPLILGILFFLFTMIYFGLAAKNLWFTFVNEGTAKIVLKAGEFAGGLIQWKGKTFDSDWNVVAEDEAHREAWHPLGGFRFYGFYPIWTIHTYELRWHDLQRAEAEVEKPVFHEKLLDYVLLRPDVYWTKLARAETGGRELERIPLDVEFLTTMRVVNPYKAMFAAPIGWVENILLRLAPVYRGFIASKTLDELLAIRGKGQEIWQELRSAHEFNLLRGVFEQEWGVEIVENGIQIKDIDLPEEYQRLATLRWKAQRERERRAEETVGAVIEAMAKSRGKTPEDIQTLIEQEPDLQQEFLEMARDFVTRDMAIAGNSFVDIRVGGAEGVEKTLLNLLAAWKRMPIGGGLSESPAGSPSGSVAEPPTAAAPSPSEKHQEVWRRIKEKKAKAKK